MAGVKLDDLLQPAELNGLRMPVLVVWGARDGIIPPECLDFFKAHLPPHAKFVEPEHFGHSPYLENPEGLTELIAGFLETGRAT